jgi:hypothetical protein
VHHLFEGHWRFFCGPRESAQFPGHWQSPSVLSRVSLLPHGPNIKHNTLDMKPMRGASRTLGVRFSIDHGDRHRTFILHTCLSCCPRLTASECATCRCLAGIFQRRTRSNRLTLQGDGIYSRFRYLGTAIVEARQTRGFHANEERRWIKSIRTPASKLYVLIL